MPALSATEQQRSPEESPPSFGGRHIRHHRHRLRANKDQFTQGKDQVLRRIARPEKSVPKAENLNVLNDFKSPVGTDRAAWRVIKGPRGIADCNDISLLHPGICTENSPLMVNTFYCLLMRKKATWITPDRGTGSY
nr:unnamed protein product [Spirometra erinaceieuropaei]